MNKLVCWLLCMMYQLAEYMGHLPIACNRFPFHGYLKCSTTQHVYAVFCLLSDFILLIFQVVALYFRFQCCCCWVLFCGGICFVAFNGFFIPCQLDTYGDTQFSDSICYFRDWSRFRSRFHCSRIWFPLPNRYFSIIDIFTMLIRWIYKKSTDEDVLTCCCSIALSNC